jgi:hypothetical protein
MIFANLAYYGLRDILGECPVDLEKIREYESIFLKQVASRYPEEKSRVVKWFSDNGIDTAYERFDSLITGVSSTGTPYIINLGDEKQFTFEVFTRPFTVLNIGAESDMVEKKINRSMSQFMSAVAKKSPTGQRSLLRRFLPAVLAFVSKKQESVSLEGDLLLIEKGGSEIYFDVTNQYCKVQKEDWGFGG